MFLHDIATDYHNIVGGNSFVAAGHPIDVAAGLSLGLALGVRPAVEDFQVENHIDVYKYRQSWIMFSITILYRHLHT